MRPVLAWALAAWLVPAPPLAAQTADGARAGGGAPFFTRADAVIAAGVVSGTLVLFALDEEIAREIRDPELQESIGLRETAAFFRHVGQEVPLVIGGGVWLGGLVARDRAVAASGAHVLEALALSGGITQVIKLTLGRARPYAVGHTEPHSFGLMRGFRGSEYRSFPSGHTSTAFALAAAGTAETFHWADAQGWSPAVKVLAAGTLFGGAALAGVSRMYEDKHWASDVVLGAAIGTFSGFKVVKYVYRNPGNRVDGWLLPDLAPAAPAAEGGLAISWTIPVGPTATR